MTQLLSTVLAVVPVRKMSIPPPVQAKDGSLKWTEFRPPVTVTLSMVTCRSSNVPSWLIPKILLSWLSATGKLPWMIVLVGPFPTIWTLALMSRSPLDGSAALLALGIVSWIGVPFVPAVKLMVQAAFGGAHAAVAFALITASRRVQSVDAAVLQVELRLRGVMSSLRLTVNVAAPAWPGKSAAHPAVAASSANSAMVLRWNEDVKWLMDFS